MGSIFREEGAKVFSIDYIPERTPHREEEIEELGRYLVNTFERGDFRPPILIGPSGTGKTLAVIKSLERLRNNPIYGPHIITNIINTMITNSTYAVVKSIVSLLYPVPERGLSISDLLKKLESELVATDRKYVVCLDDADDIIRRDKGRIVYLLTRINEAVGEDLIYPIFVVRDYKTILTLPDYIRSKVGGLIMKFYPYTRDQLRDIITERVERGLKPETITSNAIETAAIISERIYGGNAREMINLIYRSAIYAEKVDAPYIDAEIIRETFYYTFYNNIVEPLTYPHKEVMRILTSTVDRDRYIVTDNDVEEIHSRVMDQGLTYIHVRKILADLAEKYGYLLLEDDLKHVFIPRRIFQ